MELKVKQAENFKTFTSDEYCKLTQENNNIFVIPCEEVPCLYQKLIPYGNKADKLNIPYSIVEVGMVTLKKEHGATERECLILSVNFDIKINGWQFIASIDHLNTGNIVKSAVSDITLPEKYRTAKYTTCDHCHTSRYRKQTHIVYNENTNEFKQVGSSCLKVYTGLDVANIVAFADLYNAISSYNGGEDMRDFLDYSGFFNSDKYLNVRDEICLAYDLVNIYGYEKKGGKTSTAGRVANMEDYFNGYLAKYQPKKYRELKETFETKGIKFYSDESYKKADEIIKYVLSQKVTNDYMNNMHVLLENKEVERKYRNFIVSAVAVYNKGLEREKEYQQQHANDMTSKHVGNVGERLNILVKSCNTVTSWETEFGTTYIYKFIDVNDNIYTWKTTKVFRDDITSLTGTVKTHNDYKGIKQTELTRCKVA